MPGDFIDTNVLVYLASGDLKKAERAEQVVSRGGTISVQVLNELANVARRKMQLSWSETNEWLATLRRLLTIVPLTLATHERGVRLAEQHPLSIYDAMIVAAALEADCDTLWTEDLAHGAVFEQRLRVANPFA